MVYEIYKHFFMVYEIFADFLIYGALGPSGAGLETWDKQEPIVGNRQLGG